MSYFTYSMQCTSVCSHKLRHIRTCNTMTCEKFESTDNRVVAHCSTLNNDIVSKVVIATKFQYLVQAILHNRVGETRTDVGNTCALTHHLLNLRVHEDSATSAEVTRSIGSTSDVGKVLNLIVEVIGKCLEECSAT